jgi:urea transport system permease protein
MASLGTDAAREAAYDRLVAQAGLPPRVTEADVDASLAAHAFFLDFAEPDEEVALAAEAALARAGARAAAWGALDLGLDALSLSSIVFLAAVGLAITFGVMGVINMAHGEFITIGRLHGLRGPDAGARATPCRSRGAADGLPRGGGAGVALERLVIRHLAHRPLRRCSPPSASPSRSSRWPRTSSAPRPGP